MAVGHEVNDPPADELGLALHVHQVVPVSPVGRRGLEGLRAHLSELQGQDKSRIILAAGPAWDNAGTIVGYARFSGSGSD